MLGISSCLGGICCRYDGQAQEIPRIKELIEQGKALLVCPEVLAELPIPRPPAEIIGGDGFSVWQGSAQVVSIAGEDLTEVFKKRAQLAYEKLQAQKIRQLLLKEKSPSCGSHFIYDGQFSGIKKAGVGVATAYFLMKGLTVYSEADWKTLKYDWL